MPSSTLTPRIRPLILRGLVDASADSLGEEDIRRGERIAGDDLSDRNLEAITLEGCELSDVSLNLADLTAATFSETRFERLNAPVLRAPRSVWQDVSVENSRIGSADLYDAGIRSVSFVNCKLGYLNLRGAQLRDVSFEGCTIDDLDLTNATAVRLSLGDSTVRTLQLGQAKLQNVDLRRADLRHISDIESLRGATLTTVQLTDLVPVFAARLGIRLDDE